MASIFSFVIELASRQTLYMEDQNLSGVISLRSIAFSTAEDFRLATSYPWGRGP